jgi:hypothetical protein
MVGAQLRSLGMLLVTLSAVTAVMGSPAQAGATRNPLDVAPHGFAGPLLTGAACTNARDGVLLVTGERFAPGGEVRVVLYRAGRTRSALIRLVRASEPIFGVSGSTEPTRGFIPGGFIGITFGSACDEPAFVRALDQQTGIWSNGLRVKPDCELAT